MVRDASSLLDIISKAGVCNDFELREDLNIKSIHSPNDELILSNSKAINIIVDVSLKKVVLENVTGNTLILRGGAMEELQIIKESSFKKIIFEKTQIKIVMIEECIVPDIDIKNDGSNFVILNSKYKTIKADFINYCKLRIISNGNSLNQGVSISLYGKYESVIIDRAEGGYVSLNGEVKREILLTRLINCDLTFSRVEAVSTNILQCHLNRFLLESPKIEELQMTSDCNELIFNGKGTISFEVRLEPDSVNTAIGIKVLDMQRYTLSEKSKIFMANCSFEQIKLNSFQNAGEISLVNSKVTSAFVLQNSNMGKFTLGNFEISKTCLTTILESNLSDIKALNVKWLNGHKIDEKTNPLKLNEIEFQNSLRDSYRQLKQLYLNSGNRIEALEFQRGELLRHYQYVKNQTLTTSFGTKEFFRVWGDRLILGTHLYASNFGQDIWRPFLLLFLFHLVLYNGFLVANPELGYQFSFHPNWAVTCRGVTNYFATLLPTHHVIIANLRGEAINVAGFWDMFLRISSGYFIFYFITASRKYHQ